MKKKVVENYKWKGLGFLVVLKKVTMFKVNDTTWAPKIDIEKVANKVINEMSKKKANYTGHELFFIRSCLRLPRAAWGKQLGLSEDDVVKMENAKGRKVYLSFEVTNKIKKLIRARK